MNLEIGNIYPCHGGRRDVGAYWMVVGLTEGSVVMLKLSPSLEIVGAGSYGKFVFDGSSSLYRRNRTLLGKCNNIQNIKFNVKWGNQA